MADMMSGIYWHSLKPTQPMIGDCYLDPITGDGYIWQGAAWIIFSGNPTPEPPFVPPTLEQLNMHPALKQAWEEFMVVKRLLGV